MGPPFASFYFDCDSTLTRIEGINEICRGLDPELRDEIHALTDKAMNGELELSDVYEKRMAIASPDAARVEEVGRRYVEEVVPHTREVLAALQSLGKTVGIVSGGMRQAVLVLARHLGVPEGEVHAVAVHFDAEGRYAGFDRSSPLWQNGGKVEALRRLPPDRRPLCFVGDGVTDLETRAVADLFVGFGGVERREAVRAGAEVYLDRPDLRWLLGVGLTVEERKRLSERSG